MGPAAAAGQTLVITLVVEGVFGRAGVVAVVAPTDVCEELRTAVYALPHGSVHKRVVGAVGFIDAHVLAAFFSVNTRAASVLADSVLVVLRVASPALGDTDIPVGHRDVRFAAAVGLALVAAFVAEVMVRWARVVAIGFLAIDDEEGRAFFDALQHRSVYERLARTLVF